MRVLTAAAFALLVASCAVEPGDSFSSSSGRGAPADGTSAGAGGGFSAGGGMGGGGGGGPAGLFDGGCFGSVPDPQGLVPDAEQPLPVTGSIVTTSRTEPYGIAVNADLARLYFVHLPNGTEPRDPSLDVTVALPAGSWPFRPVEDETGTLHLLLRGTGELASLKRSAPSTVRKVPVCAQPRGLAVNAGADQLLVACAEGTLVRVRRTDGVVVSRARGVKDLRDVIVTDGRIFVTTMRTAELYEVTPSGSGDQLAKIGTATGLTTFSDGGFPTERVPAVAWRTVPTVDGLMMLHQRERTSGVQLGCAGYGGSLGDSLVNPAVTWFGVDGGAPVTAGTNCGGSGPFSLAVDVAPSPDGAAVAIVAAGSHAVMLVSLKTSFVSCGGPTFRTNAPFDGGTSVVSGRPLGAAITGDNRLVVMTDEPSLLVFNPFTFASDGSLLAGGAPTTIPLSTGSAKQPRSTGHRLFHDTTRANLSCAGCHPEGQDDGQVWNFAGVGPRRTQPLGGGISTTAPFHWDGDMTDMTVLMTEVMSRRMVGPTLDQPRIDAVLRWVDSIPAARATAPDAAAALRGKALFESSAVGCSSCHSGAKLTNNTTVNVGTGKAFQVSALIGLGTRTSFMHDGCAKTLTERFTNTSCGGGNMHGNTASLTSAQLADLVAYLETL